MNRKLFTYWVLDPFWGGVDYIIFQFLRCLSLNQVSNTGAAIGNIAKNRFKKACADTKTNLKYLSPDLSDDDIDDISNNMWKNIARTLTEIAVLDKFTIKGNTQEYNLQIFDKLDRNQPIVFLFPHLGNWELLAMSVIEQGYNLNIIYEPVPNRFQRRLLVTSRLRVGYNLITPDYSGTRQIFKALAKGQSIGMAMDEFKKERIIAPAFEGSIPEKSNTHYAISLARRFNAPIVYGYCKRESGVRFTIRYAEPIKFDDPRYESKSDAEIAGIINQKCKEWVLGNLDQWYMLHRARLS